MSIQTTTPTSPTFILTGCHSGITTSYSMSSNLSSSAITNNNCMAGSSTYVQFLSQEVTNDGRNVDVITITDSTPEIPPQAAPKLPSNEIEQSATCAVCGDSGAKMHYGVQACLGCKGFFRRALKKVDQYECINDNRCVINKDGRNSCRACRLRKCLDAGMNPSAVRPDRDFITKKSFINLNLPHIAKGKKTQEGSKDAPSASEERPPRYYLSSNQEEWTKKLPVEIRTMLMSLLNLEIKVIRGDTQREPAEIYPLNTTIREILEDPNKIKGKRTEMRYEPYRKAKNEELWLIVYRRVIAAIDWVEYLSEMLEGLSTDDKISDSPSQKLLCSFIVVQMLSSNCMVTDKDDILCLSNFAFVPKNIGEAYADSYHLDNNLVERLITELVKPFRKLKITEEEVVCLSAIIVLNPMAKDLSETGIQKVASLRDKIQDTLFQYIKESRSSGQATCHFGNFLLYLPLIASLSNVLNENIRFAQAFSSMGTFPLFTSVFGCFPIEPLLDAECGTLRKNVEVQTDPLCPSQERGVKRRLPSHFVSPVENEMGAEHSDFRLLRPPCSYTLTEMFEDRMNDDNSQLIPADPQMSWPQGPSTSQPPLIAYKTYPPQQLPGPSKPPINPRHSFPPTYNHTPEYYPIPQHPPPQAYHSQHHSNQPQYLQYISQPLHPASYVTPPIETLTFEHHERSHN